MQDDDSPFELHGAERPETWTQDTHAKVIILLVRSDFLLIVILSLFCCCCSDFSLQELDALAAAAAAAGFVNRNTRSLLIRRYHSISLPDSATIRAVPSFAHCDGFDYALLAADALPSDYLP
jgi:hypothetical protein